MVQHIALQLSIVQCHHGDWYSPFRSGRPGMPIFPMANMFLIIANPSTCVPDRKQVPLSDHSYYQPTRSEPPTLVNVRNNPHQSYWVTLHTNRLGAPAPGLRFLSSSAQNDLIFTVNGWTIPFLTLLPITLISCQRYFKTLHELHLHRLYQRPTLGYVEWLCC